MVGGFSIDLKIDWLVADLVTIACKHTNLRYKLCPSRKAVFDV